MFLPALPYQGDTMRRFLLALIILTLPAVLAVSGRALADAPVYQARVVETHPHDDVTSTQGLFYRDGIFYESSGGFGVSFLATVDPGTGTFIARHYLPGKLFAEGITPYNNKIYLLTWLSGNGFVHDMDTLAPLAGFAYRLESEKIEGWGLAYDGERFILSSGSATLRFYEPNDFTRTGQIVVRDGLQPIRMLNELEYVGGMLLANIWKSDKIAVIDPQTGKLRAWIDLSPLRALIAPESGVANGIAYDKENGRLFVTGKHWDKLFQIEIDESLWRQPVKE